MCIKTVVLLWKKNAVGPITFFPHWMDDECIAKMNPILLLRNQKGRKYFFFVCFSLCLFRLRVGNTRNKGIFLLCWSGESQFLIVPPAAASLPESPFLLSHLVIKEVTLEKRRGLYMKASFFTHWSVLNRTRALTWTQQHFKYENVFALSFPGQLSRSATRTFWQPWFEALEETKLCLVIQTNLLFCVCSSRGWRKRS